MLNVAVLASGSGTNLQALIDCPDESFRVCAVASDCEGAGALERARSADIPALHIQNPRDGAAIAGLLKGFDPGLVVLAGYLKLIPADFVEAYRGRIINIHPALLPAFGGKGMYGIHVHEAVLASGAGVTGATVHIIDEEYDRGTILAQWPVPVHQGDSPEDLQQRVLGVEHSLLPAVVSAAAKHGGPVPLKPTGSDFVSVDCAGDDVATALQWSD